MYKLKFHPDIYHELHESYTWYESKAKGLGENFINEIESAYISIINIPNAWPPISKIFRRFNLKKFPYGIVYTIKEDCIYVIAIMHLNRKPGY